jgi:hypothetical protein
MPYAAPESITNADGSLSPIGLERRFATLEQVTAVTSEATVANQRTMSQLLDGQREFKAEQNEQTRVIAHIDKQVSDTNGSVRELKGWRVTVDAWMVAVDAWKSADSSMQDYASGVFAGREQISKRDKAVIGTVFTGLMVGVSVLTTLLPHVARAIWG